MAASTKTCNRCFREMDRETGFQKNPGTRDGYLNQCRGCVSKQEREKREARPGFKRYHRLSDVDPNARTATCYACDGAVSIWKHGTGWKCAVKGRADTDAAARRRGVDVGRNSEYHYLSNVDEGSRTGTCSQCGLVDLYIAPHKSGSGWRCGNRAREYRQKTRDEQNEMKRRWAEENPEKASVSKRRYKAKRFGWESFNMSERDKALSLEYRKVIATDSCFYCGENSPWYPYHVDHYVPLSRGGTDHWWNLVRACEPCNLAKSNLDPVDFIQRLRRKAPGD